MSDFDKLPALRDNQLAPCVICRRVLNHDGFPLFYRFTIQRAALDRRAMAERQGIIGSWGGGAELAPLAEMLASRAPARVLDDCVPVCLCHTCAQTVTAEMLVLSALGDTPEREAA